MEKKKSVTLDPLDVIFHYKIPDDEEEEEDEIAYIAMRSDEIRFMQRIADVAKILDPCLRQKILKMRSRTWEPCGKN